MKETKSAPIDKQVFWPALIVVVSAIVPLIAFPEASSRVLGRILEVVTHQLGFLFLWFTLGVFGMLLWFAFGRYGSVKFGEPEAELAGLHTIFRLTWEMNQALANAGTVAWGIAIVLLSIGLQKQGGLARPIAWFGMFVGGAAGLGIVSGHLSLHLHGMMAVVLGVTLWCVGVATWMFRLRQRA